jgi:hypothetical protein
MKTIIICGLTWRVLSPSRYELAEQARVTMYFNGDHWRLAFDNEEGEARFTTRDDAAYAISEGINAWIWECMA